MSHRIITPYAPESQRERYDWRDDSACGPEDTELFFGGAGSSAKRARAICDTCPVKAECLEFALSDPTIVGIFGDTTQSERRQILRDRGIDVRTNPGNEARSRAAYAREQEALRLSARGVDVTVISERLGVSAESVRRYLGGVR